MFAKFITGPCVPQVKVLIAGLNYLAQSIVRLADVGSRILEVGPGDQVPEVGLDEAVVPHPADLGHPGLGVHLAEQLGRVVSLNSNGILGSNSDSWVVWKFIRVTYLYFNIQNDIQFCFKMKW